MGGVILHNKQVDEVLHENNMVTTIITKDGDIHKGDYFFSTMPVKELIHGLDPAAPESVKEVAEGLMYWDFITVGLLMEKLLVKDQDDANKRIQDNWIYIQEHEVKIGRLQIFNNWSPSVDVVYKDMKDSLGSVVFIFNRPLAPGAAKYLNMLYHSAELPIKKDEAFYIYRFKPVVKQ